MLMPAATVIGAPRPDMLKPIPLRVACEITRSVVLVLDNLTVWLVWVLIFTSPKLTTEGVMLIEGFAEGEEPLLVRAQLTSDKLQEKNRTTSSMMRTGCLRAAFSVRPIPEHSPPVFFHLLNPDFEFAREAETRSTVP
jgi:hypothetical protein